MTESTREVAALRAEVELLRFQLAHRVDQLEDRSLGIIGRMLRPRDPRIGDRLRFDLAVQRRALFLSQAATVAVVSALFLLLRV